MKSKIALHGANPADDRTPIQPVGERAPHPRLSRESSWIVMLVLSLGLWVVILEALDKVAGVL